MFFFIFHVFLKCNLKFNKCNVYICDRYLNVYIWQCDNKCIRQISHQPPRCCCCCCCWSFLLQTYFVYICPGDFSSADVLEHCFHGEPKIIISTTPDTMLQQTTNMHILKVAMSVWPKAHIIVTADNPEQASELYDAGAHYVLRSAKLCAERILEKKQVSKDWSKTAGESCPFLRVCWFWQGDPGKIGGVALGALVKGRKTAPTLRVCSCFGLFIIRWIYPPPSNSHHQDCYIFRGEPSFTTGILSWGVDPNHGFHVFLDVFLQVFSSSLTNTKPMLACLTLNVASTSTSARRTTSGEDSFQWKCDFSKNYPNSGRGPGLPERWQK